MSTLVAAAGHMNGTLHGEDNPFDGVSTDTRTIGEGELFIALEGPNFDGRDYVGVASEKGAAGAVVSALVDDADTIPQVVVADSRRALGQLGAAWREQLGTTVIGITGSNGKTTLKEMTAACLAQTAPTLATMGNLNNDIGMPLMLTRIEEGHRFAVIEMGANHVGEIVYLTAIARPDIVIYDEPTAGLDPVTTSKIYDLLRADQDETGGTVVAVSSDVGALAEFTEQVAMLYDGRIIHHGPSSDVRDADDPVVGQFVRGELEGPL